MILSPVFVFVFAFVFVVDVQPVFVVDVSAGVEVILSPAVKKSVLHRVSAHSHMCTL